jgi:23S rRNA pseudouridine1911/1915/1917 synthase
MGDQVERVRIESWAVPSDAGEVRLDAFLRKCLPQLSRGALASAIDNKFFRIGGRPTRKGDKLGAGQIVTYHGPEEWLFSQPSPANQLDVPIIYEDASLLVVNKPAGMATHGFSGKDSQTLANFLVAYHPNLLTIGKSRWEPGLVHRLDRETSGLVLVAKTQQAIDELRRQFRRREIKKIYWALVWGETEPAGTISFPITHDTPDRRRMRVVVRDSAKSRDQRSWKALTGYRALGTGKGMSLLEIDLATGVTHQIRAHLSAIGHPIVGDSLYGAADSKPSGLTRHFLHARRLQFRHPADGRQIRVESELPVDLQEVLKRLKIRI